MAAPALLAPGGVSQPVALSREYRPPAGDKVVDAAQEFEAVFLSTVISRLFDGLPTDGPFGGGNAEATFRSFLANEYAGELSRSGGIGIADQVRGELLALQESASQ